MDEMKMNRNLWLIAVLLVSGLIIGIAAACNQPVVIQTHSGETEAGLSEKGNETITTPTQAEVTPNSVSLISPSSLPATPTIPVTHTITAKTTPSAEVMTTRTPLTASIQTQPEIPGTVLLYYGSLVDILSSEDVYRVLPADEAITVFLSGQIRDMAVSPNGNELVYVLHDDQGDHLILRNLRDQKERLLFQRPEIISEMVWAPNGDELAFVQRQDLNADGEIRIMDSGGQNERWVADGSAPVWSPDGQFLAYATPLDSSSELANRIEVVDRLGQNRRVVFSVTQQLAQLNIPTPNPDNAIPLSSYYHVRSTDWSDDGNRILFVLNGRYTDLYQIEVASGKITDLMFLTQGLGTAQFIEGSNQILVSSYDGQGSNGLRLVRFPADGQVRSRELDSPRVNSKSCYVLSPDQQLITYVAETSFEKSLYDLVVYSLEAHKEILRRNLSEELPEWPRPSCDLVWLP